MPQEYYGYLDIFEEEEKTKLPPDRPGVDLDTNSRKGKDCLSKRFMRSPRTNWKNSGTTSSKIKNEDG